MGNIQNFFARKKGETLNILGFGLWSLFPIFAKLSFQNLPVLFTASGMAFFAALFFIVVVSVQRKWHELRNTAALQDIFRGTLLIGVLYYSLVFWGLKHTSAGNAAIIGLLEILFTFLLFGIWRKEQHRAVHMLGAGLMVLGAAVVLFPGKIDLHQGDLIILLASLVPPLGNFYQQQARKKVSAGVVMLGRSALSFILLFGLSFWLETPPSFGNFQAGLPYLIVAGIGLFGISKILYIESLSAISVPRAIALTAIAPAFTLLFAYLFLTEIPNLGQILGLLPIAIGAFFITKSPISFSAKDAAY